MVSFETDVKWIDWFYKVLKNKLLTSLEETDISIAKALMGCIFQSIAKHNTQMQIWKRTFLLEV